MASPERVLIVDYGSQYTQLIARRVREQHVYCEVVPPWIETEQVRRAAPKALILSGGPASVTHADAPQMNEDILDLGIPVLGICYGMQLLVQHLGGLVEPASESEYGRAELDLDAPNEPLFQDVPARSVVWMSHGDRVTRLPAGFEVVGSSDNSPFAAVHHRERPLYGLQFHPEVVHTEAGTQILQNFLRIAGVTGDWTMHEFVESQIREIRERVGDRTVICGVSGGVDSTVVAVLLDRAIGDQLRCVFVDNGLMRHDEASEVVEMFRGLGIGLDAVDAAAEFVERLRGVEDPEKKRVIIGHLFVEVFERAARQIPNATFLAQGTLYPDVIESISVWGPSATIKTHHNVGGLPERMSLEIVEPLRMLFKDEVRELADELGIAREASRRHPFPGPGLGIRVLGEVTEERLEMLRAADRIVLDEIRAAGWYDRLWQAFAVFLPVRSVGVMGDARTYEHAIAVRCITSKDAMTGDWAALPPELLARISNRISNEVDGINRVVYDISSKPPATIEWE
ncbi:MAG: glutamine-hydrolyzing GMP synthase [Deltaproteobacteria bacterium]|nr:glutamine-hydrolyzing GMP synthase [Deltaproteobacteria bacterium]MBW2413552.1 glutamine-hydrolyzing GMP synthase [Deltaproteobacteria bacterium]